MKLIAIIFLFFSVVSAIPFGKRSLVLPVNDTFYQEPANLASYAVGEIIQKRQISNPFYILIVPQLVKSVYQFQVRSEDSHGNPMAIVTTLFVPTFGNRDTLLSYHIAEDAANIDCAPSFTMQAGSNSSASLQAEETFIQAAINQGWYVVVPDYEGPNSAFGAGLLAGKAALNSVRAALSSGSFTGIKSTAKVAYWGYSGGSIPTGWAALLTKTYAPELVANNVGYALGGIVADINDVAKQRMGGAFSSLIITAINGLSTEYPELLDYINSNVYPDKLQVFTSPLATCASNDPALSNAAWSYFFKDGSNTLSNPVVKQVTTDNSMVNSSLVPTAPLFFYNSLLDEVIPPSEADNFYNNLCKAGVSVTYKQDLLNGHITESFAGAGQAFVWLQSVLNGKTYKGCSKSFSISNAASPTGLLGLGVVFAQTLTEIYVANFFNNIL